MESALKILEFTRICEKLAGYASSNLGEELALKIGLLQDNKELAEALTQVTELRDILDYDQAIPIDGIIDIRSGLRKARVIGSILRVDELASIGQTLSVVRKLTRYFGARKEKIPACWKVAKCLFPLPSIEDLIFSAIDSKTFEIRDKASPDLAKIRQQIHHAQERAKRKMEAMLKSLGAQGLLQENVISVRGGRLVLVVKEEYKRKVRGLVHDQSASGASVFIEPLDVLEANNRIRELQADEKKEIERILRLLTDEIRAYLNDIEENIHVLAEIDFIYAKAGFSKAIQGYQPELVDQNYISIAQGRHPLLLLRMGQKAVVPLDIKMGVNHFTFIISGPNAGGKTVALKTIGLLTLMARSGLHISAQPHSKIGSIHKVFASIGDQQSIENDLSTFSSHLESLNGIISNADANSLVLIDEIGSGTDPEEGSALAMALLQHLTNIKCLSVVTTHQSSLKAYAFQTEFVENASMEFDVSTLEPTYGLRVGVPGSSYAFEIARRMGLPAFLMDSAKEFVGTKKDTLEALILELDEKIQEHKKLNASLNVKETELNELTRLYNERNKKYKAEEKHLKRKALQEAELIVSQANATIEKVVRDIKEKQADKNAIREAQKQLVTQRAEIQKLKSTITDVKPKPETTAHVQPQNGDFALWEKFNVSGYIASTPDKQGRVLFQSGGAKVQVPLEELTKIKKPKKFHSGIVNVNISRPEVYKNEVDLRGLNSEEAIERVDRFMDEAQLAGFREITVIHGKGTGKLRSSVTTFLQKPSAGKRIAVRKLE